MKHDGEVYRNNDDTRRGRIFENEDGRWDLDLYKRNQLGGGWAVEKEYFGQSTERTHARAVSWLEDLIGTLTPIDVAIVTEGWPEREPPKPTKDAAIKIQKGQIWRQGSRRLRVQEVEKHWNQKVWPGALQVQYRWIDLTGRETGTAIVGRRHPQWTHEQRFREKFRFVEEAP